MKLTFLLADYAQVQSGKLYLMGGGWNMIGPQIGPSAIAGLVHVEWKETNQNHVLTFDLVHQDGEPFMTPTPMGLQPFHIEMKFQVGRPAGVATGSELNMPFAINLAPLPFEPGHRYEWRPKINGGEIIEARLAFSVREAPPTEPFQQG
ncbi:MAG TPA: hypothetical protein VGI19_14600 [Candidatus Cybelea sp.]|jgi:hypothetical protein